MGGSFEDVYMALNQYWKNQLALSWNPYDIEIGAGTFNPATFFGVLGSRSLRVCYLESSRRPSDGRYGENPNRLYQHHQFQVILKPAPKDIQHLYVQSLKAIGIDIDQHDIRFIQDDWQSPTLGASGLGWEVRLDGMEITQFTYFQRMGSVDLEPISVELTYGLERILMFLQNKDTVYDLVWKKKDRSVVLYRDLFQKFEYEFSVYNFETANIDRCLSLFNLYEEDCQECLTHALIRPAYDMVLKMSHMFNILDARNAISVSERVSFIDRVRKQACCCAQQFIEKQKTVVS